MIVEKKSCIQFIASISQLVAYMIFFYDFFCNDNLNINSIAEKNYYILWMANTGNLLFFDRQSEIK